MPPERKETAQGHEMAFATHVLGPFLLTAGLRPLLQADGDGRVVFVSSGGMYTSGLETDLEYTEGEYKGVRAYARTKRMQVVLTEQLGTAFSAAERSGGAQHASGVGGHARGQRFDSRVSSKVAGPILRSPELGADTIVWLLAAPEAAAQHRAVLVRPSTAAHALPALAAGRPGGQAGAVGRLPGRHRGRHRLS